MGMFDFFGREPKIKEEVDNRPFQRQTEERTNINYSNGPVSVFFPQSFRDVEGVILALKNGKNAIVHLEKIQPETSKRILDMLSGAVFALGGGLYEIQANTYMVSPSGVELN